MSASSFNNYQRAFGLYEPGVTLSADGRYLAYASFAEGSRHASVMVVDAATGALRVVGAGSENYAPALSATGSALAFTAAAADRSAPDRIAVADLATGRISFASSSASGEAGNGHSHFAAISADGRYVAFESAASNLVAGDTNGAEDVFVKDMISGAVRRLSVGAGGAQLPGDAGGACISADGGVVLFRTLADAASGAMTDSFHLYARNLASGAIALVAADSSGRAALSADGRYVVFSAGSPGREVFRKDLSSGALELVSASVGSMQGAGWNADPSVSNDGRYVSFGYETRDAALAGSPVINEIFVRDMLTGSLAQVSHGAEPGEGSFHPRLSDDGSQLAFVRYAGTLGPNYDVSWDVMTANIVTDSGVSARGTAGNDLFASSPNDDAWNGGAGLDVAAYRGRMAEYGIRAGAAVQVSDHVAGRDGVDTLQGVERLRFADAMLALDTGVDDIAGQAYRIYQAAFNRVPDKGGVGFWISAMDRGQTLQSVAAGFVQSGEFKALYGAAPSSASVVENCT
ncbi:MAG: PD40 domain-containing protein [Massilia sp.]|nr:PD40 domain-containing protein [Massilia sp.]